MRMYIHDSEGKRVVEAAEDAKITEVVGSTEVDVGVWVEGADEPLRAEVTVAEVAVAGHASVHVGRGRVTVQVFYNGMTKSKSFGPGNKVEKVFDWAVGSTGFSLPATDAQTLALRLHGSPEDLDPDVHVGTLADKQRDLLLDLLPGERFAG